MTRHHPRTGAVDVGRVDGNAAAGPLGELFRVDVTVATAECAHCGSRGVLAETVAEIDDDGVIVLCRACGHTLLTLVESRGETVLEIAGLRALRFDRDA